MLFRIREWSRKFWNDELGAVVSAELALIATLGIVGATVGIETVAKSVNEELTDVAMAFRSLDQSYCVAPKRSCTACVAGSSFQQQDVKISREELRMYQQEITGGQKEDQKKDETQLPKKLKKQNKKKNKQEDDSEDSE